MTALSLLVVVAIGFVLGLALGRWIGPARRTPSSRAARSVTALPRRAERPALRVITGGRPRKSAGA